MSHPTTSARLALLVLAWLVGLGSVAVGPAAASRCAAGGSAAELTAASLEEAATSVVREVNRERAERELTRLDTDLRLALAAHRHARDMVRRGYFSHVTPDGRAMTARVRATGYLRGAVWWGLGEVLAWGTGACSTPVATVAAWMRSPSHRRVMLGRRYLEIGVGIELGVPSAPRSGATYAVELGVVRP